MWSFELVKIPSPGKHPDSNIGKSLRRGKIMLLQPCLWLIPVWAVAKASVGCWSRMLRCIITRLGECPLFPLPKLNLSAQGSLQPQVRCRLEPPRVRISEQIMQSDHPWTGRTWLRHNTSRRQTVHCFFWPQLFNGIVSTFRESAPPLFPSDAHIKVGCEVGCFQQYTQLHVRYIPQPLKNPPNSFCLQCCWSAHPANPLGHIPFEKMGSSSYYKSTGSHRQSNRPVWYLWTVRYACIKLISYICRLDITARASLGITIYIRTPTRHRSCTDTTTTPVSLIIFLCCRCICLIFV
jgi:hypothetical protein